MGASLVLALAACAAVAGSSARAQGQAVRLFDGKTLKGWYTFTTEHGKNNDPLGIFKIEDGMFHVSGQKFGYLSTEQEYENYKITLQYKWGEKKWPPRENVVRDAGLLYHVTGKDMVWANCLEMQIQEGDTGDLFLIPGEGEAPSAEVLGQKIGGVPGYHRGVKWADYEKPHGEWNTVTAVVGKDRVEHWVNGRCNLVLKRPNRSRGKIQLQSEGAEIWYRNIVLEPLDQ